MEFKLYFSLKYFQTTRSLTSFGIWWLSPGLVYNFKYIYIKDPTNNVHHLIVSISVYCDFYIHSDLQNSLGIPIYILCELKWNQSVMPLTLKSQTKKTTKIFVIFTLYTMWLSAVRILEGKKRDLFKMDLWTLSIQLKLPSPMILQK